MSSLERQKASVSISNGAEGDEALFMRKAPTFLFFLVSLLDGARPC